MEEKLKHLKFNIDLLKISYILKIYAYTFDYVELTCNDATMLTIKIVSLDEMVSDF